MRRDVDKWVGKNISPSLAQWPIGRYLYRSVDTRKEYIFTPQKQRLRPTLVRYLESEDPFLNLIAISELIDLLGYVVLSKSETPVHEMPIFEDPKPLDFHKYDEPQSSEASRERKYERTAREKEGLRRIVAKNWKLMQERREKEAEHLKWREMGIRLQLLNNAWESLDYPWLSPSPMKITIDNDKASMAIKGIQRIINRSMSRYPEEWENEYLDTVLWQSDSLSDKQHSIQYQTKAVFRRTLISVLCHIDFYEAGLTESEVYRFFDGISKGMKVELGYVCENVIKLKGESTKWQRLIQQKFWKIWWDYYQDLLQRKADQIKE